ncbi:MAG: ATP-dependent sacrificial sulfur transferase LarE [bacterium]
MNRRGQERGQEQGQDRKGGGDRVALKKLDELGGVPGPLAAKAAEAVALVGSLCPAVVAFSGGVDSSLLLALAAQACPDRTLAVVASSATYPRRELENARRIAALVGVPVRVLKTRETEDPAFRANPLDRCYLCKRELFAKIKRLAEDEGYAGVVEGSNVDDLGDFRPGERALREAAIASPLRQAGFTKAEVRDLARRLGLPNWDKPAAACLASRFPYGAEITREALARIERLEEVILDLGFSQARARCHGDLLRIELEPAGLERAASPEVRDRLVEAARREGFRYVTLDLGGYRTGSFNP